MYSDSRTYLKTFVWLLSALQIARTIPTCGPLEVGPNGDDDCVDMRWCLYKLYKKPRNWADARQICSQDGYDFLRVKDVAEHNFLTSYFQSSLSIAIPHPFDSTLWLGMQQNDGDVPRWQDDCSTQPAGYNPVTAAPGANCFMFNISATTYTNDACAASKMFLCKAKSYDISTCYTTVVTFADATFTDGVVGGMTAAVDCAQNCDVSNCVGYRYFPAINECKMVTAGLGISYTKGAETDKFMKDLQRTEFVVITEPVSLMSDACQYMYTTSPHVLPVIETTMAPDSVSTLDTTMLLMPSTAHAYPSVSVTRTVAIVPSTGDALQTMQTLAPDSVSTLDTITWPMPSTSYAYPSVSFTGTVSIVPSTVLGAALQNLSDNIGQMKTANMTQLTLFCKQLLGHVLDQPDHMCSNLENIRQIEDQIATKMETLPTGDLDMNTTVDSYLRILNLAYGFDMNMGCQHDDKTSDLLDLQDALVRMAKLYLRLQNTSKTFEHNGTSMFITVGDGSMLQGDYSTTYGRVMVQHLEASRRILANQKLMITVISYKENPFRYSQPPHHINIPVMTTVAFDEDGWKIQDLHFIMGFPFSSKLDTNDSNTIDMVSNGTHYMAAFPGGFFNSSPAMMFVDVSLMGPCRIYGKYGTTSPTDHDFDFYLHTNGFLSVTKYRPYSFIFSFIEGIVQLPIYQTPVIITTQCQAGKFTKHGDVPTLRINQVLPQVIDNATSDWKSNNNVQLVGGRTSEITLKSYFFGTFTANVKLISPDMIDFQTVFLNFSEKLIDTPYVLGTVIAVLIALAITTPLLRRWDVIDSALWSYQHLVDNKASSNFHYYICVSTGVRSKRQMESSVYINIIGTRDETGARLLTGNNRKNFGNGTSSHFCLKSDVYLGNIKTVHIWLGGSVESQSWYLTRVVIIDGKTSNAIQLKCNKWLSLEKGTGQTWRTLRVRRNTNNASSLSEVSTRNIFDDHLWFSLLFRPRYSKFTRVQRLWSIVSLLFLSMVASAMFYDTPDDTLPLLNVANFELGYKEIYTGLMSGLITVVPSLIITYIFSNRKQLGEKPLSLYISYTGDTFRSSGNLPWWSIFLAYTVLLTCIISGSFFTLLYSLEWGPSLTIKWMSTFFLGTTESVMLIEPTKAIVLAILLVCLCSEKTNRSHFHLPPTSVGLKQQTLPFQGRPAPLVVKSPCEAPETGVQRQRRFTLDRDRRLNRLLRKLVFGAMYVALLLLLGSNLKVSDMHGQNLHMKNVVKPTQEITTMEDVWNYIQTSVLRRLYPLEFFNEMRFVGDLFKMGPIRLRQIRVSGTCTTPSLMRRTHGIACIPEYDTDTEDTANYREGWITVNMSDPLNDYKSSPYRYHHSDPNESPPYSGHFGTYGGGGYLTDLDVVPTKAVDVVNRLQSNVWLDGRTRALLIEACLVNRNNMIFTQIQIVFEFPNIGGIFTDTTVVSSNLYPYRDTFGYIILFIQVMFAVTILARFMFVIFKLIKTRGQSIFIVSHVVDMFHLGVSVTAVVCLVMRFTSTIAVLNTLRQDMGFYTSFGYVFRWDEYYSIALGMTTFIAILDLLKHLSFNYHFFLMYRTIMAFRMELLQFTVVLSVLIVGFACLINLMYGHMEEGFRSISSGILTLFRMTIGLIKFRNDIKVAVLGIFIIIAIYAFGAMVVFVNLFTGSLNVNLTHIKQLIKDGKTAFDCHLSQHFWGRLANLLTICGVEKPNNPRETDKIKDIALHQGELSFDRFFSKVTIIFEEDDDDEKLEIENLRRTLLHPRR